MLSPSSNFQRIVFDRFEADLLSGELRKNGRRIRLQAKPFQLLALLLERAGEVVTREEVCGKLWDADTFVDFDHSLGTAINKIREALGDSADAPRFVETLPRRGYRFIFPVTLPREVRAGAAPAAAGAELKPAGKTNRFSWAAAFGATIVIVGLAVPGWWFFSRKAHA
jgi:DNA-binding winged helix-turn-helix (wHTH) protein